MKRFGKPVSFKVVTDSGDGRCSYSDEFQMMLEKLDEEDCLDACNGLSGGAEKKRRLSLHQINVLEKYFERENKLDPEGKFRLAEQLGLQPRQVAVWFQNRRARWKTKQLERDFALLKANYDALRLGVADLEQQKVALNAELQYLKGKVSSMDSAIGEQSFPFWGADYINNANNILSGEIGSCEFNSGGLNNHLDSDSLGNFNVQQQISPAASSLTSLSPASPMGLSDISGFRSIVDGVSRVGQSVKLEDEQMTGFDDSYNFFFVDDAPTLCWHYTNR